MRRFAALRRQSDFARMRRQGERFSTHSLTIYRSKPLHGDVATLVGITVSKSIGKAVVRNRVRRRLAAIVHDALRPGTLMRLLIVVRPAAVPATFNQLRAEVTSALQCA